MSFLVIAIALQVSPIEQSIQRAVEQDECSSTAGDDSIVVCGRRDKADRYRLPDRDQPFDPKGNVMSVMRERSRWTEGMNVGTQSCSAVGPGGWTGCMIQDWNRNDLQNPRRE